MKFLSVTVLVIFAFVPVTYSNYVAPTSWKPIELQNKYLNNNIQNTYQPNGQILQPVRDPPIPNPTQQSIDSRSQASPNQYVNQIGPTFSYQPQNVPITQNTQPTSVQNNVNGFTPPLPAQPLQYSLPDAQQFSVQNNGFTPLSPAQLLQYAPPNLNLKSIYQAAKPTKQYTIVHLNGTVEQTDDLQAIIARHPNFVMLKASDLLASKYLSGQNTGIPPVQAASISTQKPVATAQQAYAPNQNIGLTSNSYQGVYNNQQPIPNSPVSLVTNPSPSDQSISNVKSEQPAKGATLVPISATPNFQQPISQNNNITNQQVPTNPTNAYLGGSNSQSTLQSSNGTVLPTVSNIAPPQTVSSIPNYNVRSLTQANILPLNQQNETQKNIYNETANNQVASQPDTGDLLKNAVASNPSAFDPPVYKLNISNVPSNVSYGSPSTNTLPENAVTANPLPIYPETSVPNATVKSTIPNEPFAVGAAVAQVASVPVQQPLTLPNDSQNITLTPQIIKDKYEAITAINSNISIPYTDAQNRTSSINLPISTNPIPASSPNISETLPIVLPKQPQNTSTLQKAVPSSITQELNPIEVKPDNSTVDQVKPVYNIIPIENKTTEPITKITTSVGTPVLVPTKSIVDSSTPNNAPNVTGTIAQPIDKANVTVNSTKSPDIELNKNPEQQQPTDKPVNSSSTIPSLSNEPSTLPPADKPWSLLTLNDDNIWDIIGNNTQNLYFFFLPPRPKVTKESRTIIFANGTTVEEVTETVVDIGPDGEPKVTITTTKSQS